jgi:putative ABC transport system permease protein
MFWRRRRSQSDFTAEIQAHLEAEADVLRGRGYSEEEAKTMARRAFGNVRAAEERFYEARRWLAWDSLVRDVRYALRTLRKTPGLVALVVLCLGLGIGVNTTLFSLFNAVLLRGPSAREPERLVQIEPGNGDQISYLNYQDLGRPAGFADLAISRRTALNFSSGSTLQSVSALQVSANFFELLGVGTSRGRTFTALETPDQRPQLAVLDPGFARRQFPGMHDVVGRVLVLNGEPFTAVGILPDDYRPGLGLFVPELYVPIGSLPSRDLQDRRPASFDLRGRLASGTTREQARDAFQAAARRLESAYPRENEGLGRPPLILPVSGMASIQGRGAPRELPLVLAAPFVVFGILLCIACANVSGVLLARGASRRPEIGIRLAIGASRASLVRMLLAECVVLSIIATAGGVLLTVLVTPLLNLVPLPNAVSVSVPAVQFDFNLVAYAAGVAIVTCLVCGLVPAMQATRLDLTASLREVAVSGRRRRGVRRILVGAQVAASALLLVACLLFLRSLSHVATLDPGFDIGHGITALISLEENRFTPQAGRLVAEQLSERLQAVPGVTSVSFASLIPLAGDMVGLRVELRDRPGGSGVPVWTSNVGPRYFETMGIGVRSGREFLSSDRVGARPVIIVNEAFARRAFPDGAAVGRSIHVLSERDDPWREIVAVVADNKYASLNEAPYPQVFLPYLQTGGRLFVQVRTTTPPGLGVAAVKRAIGEFDKSLLVNVRTTADATSVELTLRRLATTILGAMGTLGLLLAMIGLFGVLAWDVTRRTPEIGIRMALGASRRTVRNGVLRDALGLVGAGIAVGLAAAVVVTLPLRGFLAGVSTADPFALGGVAVVLLAVALLASTIPAHRASGIDPITALRRE